MFRAVSSWLGTGLIVGALTLGVTSALRVQADVARPLAGFMLVAAATPDSGLDIRRTKAEHRAAGQIPVLSGIPYAKLTPSPPPAPPAPPAAQRGAPAIAIGSTQQVLINRDRAAAGLAPLSWSSCLNSVAVSNARRMAAQGFISHTNGPNADLTCGLGNRAGENVGYWTGGVNDSQLNTMFMNSSDHRANIMGPYHYVATAWVTAANGTAYIAVEF
ncbi:MAG TPA: CAP domain-containing protein, partial [Candidatus Dormibacteraeota bacterium]|nr:CAP domain-containing protein [Candidatus Dormibacteraeota bacterium]